jgi:hypothetical protein
LSLHEVEAASAKCSAVQPRLKACAFGAVDVDFKKRVAAVIAKILAALEKASSEDARPELAPLAARAPPAQPRLI